MKMIDKIVHWLHDPPKGWQWLGMPCAAIAVDLSMTKIMIAASLLLDHGIAAWHQDATFALTFSNRFVAAIANCIPFAVMMNAGFEELMFRAAALGLCVDFKKRCMVIPVIILTALWCAYTHGGPPPRLVLQGCASILYSAMFLKCGGGQGKFVIGWLCATFVHGLSNMIYVALMTGE